MKKNILFLLFLFTLALSQAQYSLRSRYDFTKWRGYFSADQSYTNWYNEGLYSFIFNYNQSLDVLKIHPNGTKDLYRNTSNGWTIKTSEIGTYQMAEFVDAQGDRILIMVYTSFLWVIYDGFIIEYAN